MVEQIYFNKKYSYDDFGLLLVESPIISNVYEDVETIVVPGRSGSLTKRLGTYKDRTIKTKFKLVDTDKYIYEETLIYIVDWLNNIKDNQLTINESDYSYKVKKIEIGDIQRELDWYGDFEVIFTCEPFKYGFKQHKSISQSKNVFYLGTVETSPILKVFGNGDMDITLGDTTFILKGIVDSITIDCDRGLCYKIEDGVYNNLNKKMNGEYPKIKPGINNLSWLGDISKIEMSYEIKYL